VSKIEVEDGKLVVERSLENEVEVLEVRLPAALSVTTDINQPRLPGMKEILKAGKKPVIEWSLADLGLTSPVQNRVEVLQTRAPHRNQRKQTVVGGTAQEAAQALVAAMVKEGLI
jgi:electron transfer flavoprotein beta subunit